MDCINKESLKIICALRKYATIDTSKCFSYKIDKGGIYTLVWTPHYNRSTMEGKEPVTYDVPLLQIVDKKHTKLYAFDESMIEIWESYYRFIVRVKNFRRWNPWNARMLGDIDATKYALVHLFNDEISPNKEHVVTIKSMAKYIAPLQTVKFEYKMTALHIGHNINHDINLWWSDVEKHSDASYLQKFGKYIYHYAVPSFVVVRYMNCVSNFTIDSFNIKLVKPEHIKVLENLLYALQHLYDGNAMTKAAR